MPMYNSNVVPDVTGRTLGAPDKQWDVYARNIVLSGALSGTGLTTSDISNVSPDVDSINVQSGIDQASLKLRFQITNPSVGIPVAAFKNSSILLGGINPADSPAVPIAIQLNAGDVSNPLGIYRRGSASSLAMVIDAFGRITSYCPAYTTYGFQVSRLGETNGIWVVDANGSIGWGAGGSNNFDTFLTRTAANALSLNNGAGGWANLSLGVLSSNAAQGTAPLNVVSTTRVPNLNADWLDGASWDAPPAIGGTTPGDGHFAALSATAQISSSLNDGVTPPLNVASAIPVPMLRVKFGSDFTVENSLVNDGSGVKHKRVTTGSVAGGATLNLQIFWTTPFATSNYTALASMFDSFGSGGSGEGLRIKRITQINTDHIAVLIINDDATNAHTGTVQAIGIKG